jgi:hypothetical protein
LSLKKFPVVVYRSWSRIRRLSATDLILCTGRRAAGFSGTATSGIRSTKHGVDHGRRTTNARLHGNGVERTIPAAGAALHARIAILDLYVPGIHFEHLVRTDIKAHSTARAFLFIQF